MSERVEGTFTCGRLRVGGQLRVEEQMIADVGGATFASDQAVIRGRGAPLSTGGDVAVDFLGFSGIIFFE